MTRPKVLLVDDTPEVLEHCAELLTPSYDIIGTHDGKSAIAAFEATQPDVLVLDISMPKLNGIEVARHLRRSGCQAAIIFMSGSEDRVTEALEAGGSAFVSKTSVASDLPVAIEEALAGRVFVSNLSK
jgi:DNA-binding NarL/FixJ family response regulator